MTPAGLVSAFAVLSLAACGAGDAREAALEGEASAAPAAQEADGAAPRVADPVAIEKTELPNAHDVQAEPGAQAWAVVQEESSLTFAGSLDGDALRGEFTEWSADIRFDPQNLAGSSIRGVVQPGSIDTGDSSQDETAASDGWLGGEEAVFISDDIRQAGAGYEAAGVLTVNGQSAPLILPFTVVIDADRAEAQSEFVLQRADWGIGGGDFDGAVSDEITVKLDITAEKAP